jgi:hypothetical protein
MIQKEGMKFDLLPISVSQSICKLGEAWGRCHPQGRLCSRVACHTQQAARPCGAVCAQAKTEHLARPQRARRDAQPNKGQLIPPPHVRAVFSVAVRLLARAHAPAAIARCFVSFRAQLYSLGSPGPSFSAAPYLWRASETENFVIDSCTAGLRRHIVFVGPWAHRFSFQKSSICWCLVLVCKSCRAHLVSGLHELFAPPQLSLTWWWNQWKWLKFDARNYGRNPV